MLTVQSMNRKRFTGTSCMHCHCRPDNPADGACVLLLYLQVMQQPGVGMLLSGPDGSVWHAVLLGPVHAATYALTYGLLSTLMGALWVMQTPWWFTITCCAIVRMLGQGGMLAISSWAMNENLLALILHNLHGLLVSFHSLFGHCSMPCCPNHALLHLVPVIASASIDKSAAHAGSMLCCLWDVWSARACCHCSGSRLHTGFQCTDILQLHADHIYNTVSQHGNVSSKSAYVC